MNADCESVDGAEHPAESSGRPKKRVLIAFVIGAVALFVAVRFLPIRGFVVNILEWTHSLGMWAPIVFAIIYIAACVLFVPGLILTIGGGFLFGVVKGTVVVSIASTLGATAAFLVGRTIARKRIEKMVAGRPKFAAIDRAVAKEGFKFVFLTRLSPVFPFNLLNYAFGLTRVPLWKYVLASWIGMLPATVVYVYAGSGLESIVSVGAGAAGRKTAAEAALFWVGLAITVVIVVVVTRVARRALREVEQEAFDKPERAGGDADGASGTEG